MARSQLRDAKVHETAAAVAERGKDLGAKGWSFIKGVYGTVATQVETVAKDSGYKLDLGERRPPVFWTCCSPLPCTVAGVLVALQDNASWR